MNVEGGRLINGHSVLTARGKIPLGCLSTITVWLLRQNWGSIAAPRKHVRPQALFALALQPFVVENSLTMRAREVPCPGLLKSWYKSLVRRCVLLQVRLVCGAFLNPGNKVQVFLIPNCASAQAQLGITFLSAALNSSFFIAFVMQNSPRFALKSLLRIRNRIQRCHQFWQVPYRQWHNPLAFFSCFVGPVFKEQKRFWRVTIVCLQTFILSFLIKNFWSFSTPNTFFKKIFANIQ